MFTIINRIIQIMLQISQENAIVEAAETWYNTAMLFDWKTPAEVRLNYANTIYFGSEKRNSSPPPCLFLTVIFPLKLRMAFFTMANPRPVPPILRERPESTR